MQTPGYIILSLSIGALLSIYLPMNSAVSKHLGSSITANITFFFIAFLASVFIFIIWGELETVQKIKDVPLWLYSTGIFSAIMILGTTYLIPKVGIRQYFILMISGQILMAIFMSHFGVFGTPKDVITVKKVVGALFIILGAIFSTV